MRWFAEPVAFVMQGIGAIQVATGTTAATLQHGKSVVLAGLGVQLAAFGFFSTIGIRFNIKSRNFTQPPSLPSTLKTPLNPYWMGLLIALNTSCALILVRSIYRVVEFTTGTAGYVSVHEWTSYIFDALPISLYFCCLCSCHQGNMSLIWDGGFRSIGRLKVGKNWTIKRSLEPRLYRL